MCFLFRIKLFSDWKFHELHQFNILYAPDRKKWKYILILCVSSPIISITSIYIFYFSVLILICLALYAIYLFSHWFDKMVVIMVLHSLKILHEHTYIYMVYITFRAIYSYISCPIYNVGMCIQYSIEMERTYVWYMPIIIVIYIYLW